MNAGGNNNAVNPIEHVYFDNPKAGEYFYWVNYFSQKNGGPDSSEFILSVMDNSNNVLQVFPGRVSKTEKDSSKQKFVLKAD